MANAREALDPAIPVYEEGQDERSRSGIPSLIARNGTGGPWIPETGHGFGLPGSRRRRSGTRRSAAATRAPPERLTPLAKTPMQPGTTLEDNHPMTPTAAPGNHHAARPVFLRLTQPVSLFGISSSP